jgi:uncharacterized damage-inducible protein DinB
MTTYGPTQLANAFRTVRRNTVQIAQDIPEDKYDFVPAPGMQSVSQMLRHIAASPYMHEHMHGDNRVHSLKGYDFPALIGKIRTEESKPRTKAEIVEHLKAEGERFAQWLESIPPEQLIEEVTDTTGQNPRTRFEQLLGAKEHEMHHRGQLMVVERMLGIVPHLTRQREEQRQRQTQAASQQPAATAKA